MKRLLALAGACLLSAACGSTSATAPTPTTTTRIMAVSGDLSFGNVMLGSTVDRTFTIGNTGNATLTFTSLSAVCCTGQAGFTATPSSGTIAPGAAQTITLDFAPTVAQFYSNVLTIASDRTSGGNEINVSGTGVAAGPLFTRSGMGSAVFDMPTTVSRVHITGDYSGYCQSFIVHIGSGGSVVNVLLGSCSGASEHYDGIAPTTGGVVSITGADGVSWSFTEVR